MRLDEVTEALVVEAERRYHTDAEFHAIVDTAVRASIDNPYFTFTSEGLKTFVRGLMIKSTSLALVLQEHTGND